MDRLAQPNEVILIGQDVLYDIYVEYIIRKDM